MTKEIKPFETWVIRNKTTGEYFVAPSGKNSWKARGHAKNAWASVSSNWHTPDQEILDKYGVEAVGYFPKYTYPIEKRFRFPKFNEQDTWELVNLAKPVEEVGSDLKEARYLLERTLLWGVSYDLEDKINEFLRKTK